MDHASKSALTRTSQGLPWSDQLPAEADVVIVGGGFSGLMALAHLAVEAPASKLVLVERRPTRAPGVAYGACDPIHLLNVPANRMGATSADVGGFHAWLEARHPGEYKPDSFAPRRLYGQYLLELVEQRIAKALDRVVMVHDAAVHMDRTEDGLDVLMSSGRTCAAGCVVLAPGIPAARAPWSTMAAQVPKQHLIADPWDAGAFDGISSDAPLVVVGSGLTAIDVVLSVRSRGHRGRITLVSRNGRLPLPHAMPGETPHQIARTDLSGGPAKALAVIRRAVRERAERGQSWQPVLDALRAHTADIWRSWTTAQRQSFLHHARSYWEVHRHRVPRQVLEPLSALMDQDILQVVQGQLAKVTAVDAGSVRVEYEGKDRQRHSLVAARVFNCIGPTTSVRHTSDPLLRSLIGSGMAAPDAAGLGILADHSGHVLGAEGTPDPRIFLVGALRRADAWESTAVPELRVQSERVAHAVAAALAAARLERGS